MAQLGRNDPCSCGSGKKFKKCCMNSVGKQTNEISDALEQTLAMNPNLSIDELNLVAERMMHDRNNKPVDDFCGISPNLMQNWLYAPFNALQGIKINTPTDFSASPVMRYLELMINAAMENNGKFKATSKGNLPTFIVKQATELRPELPTSDYPINISISEFAGANEDKFNALHYTRILAEVAGIIYRRGGYFHVKKDAQKQFLKHGLGAFFMPMLEVAVSRYNWAYFDSYGEHIDIRLFWVFMLWRIQKHRSLNQLAVETSTAFPDILAQIPQSQYTTVERTFSRIIEIRFIERFLQYWGFLKADPWRFNPEEEAPRNVELQPMLAQTFVFEV